MWVKEDACRAGAGYAPQNLSVLLYPDNLAKCSTEKASTLSVNSSWGLNGTAVPMVVFEDELRHWLARRIYGNVSLFCRIHVFLKPGDVNEHSVFRILFGKLNRLRPLWATRVFRPDPVPPVEADCRICRPEKAEKIVYTACSSPAVLTEGLCLTASGSRETMYLVNIPDGTL
jgi:hypothetical protein